MSSRRDRPHRAWNAYSEERIETIEEAIEVAMERTDCESQGEALSALAQMYVELGLYDDAVAETVFNALDAAEAEEGVDGNDAALREVARCYTGWSAGD